MTMSTSRTESRCQPPSDSGSKTREPLKTLESSVAKQKRLQRLGAPQHEPGSSRPSRTESRSQVASSPAEFLRYVRAESDKLGKLIRENNIVPE